MTKKKTTIEELFLSGERYATITVHFPQAGHVEVEGRLRHVPNSRGGESNYWVGKLCLPSTKVLESDGTERSTWNVYCRDCGGAS